MVRVASMIVAGVLLLGTVGCSDNDGSPESAATTSTAESSTSSTSIASTFEPGDRYVALGSSIASGVGIPEQSASCGRSSRNYPNLVAERYGLDLVDVTCAAAVIPNVLDTPQGDSPPQITAVTAETKLITVTVGGNDIAYNGTALACGNPDNVCTEPAGLASNLAALPQKLADMIDALESAAPSATIVFVTYPREVPETNCPALSYTDAEAAVVRSMGERLEATFVDVLKDTAVVLVDPYPAPGDHTGCAPEAERWTAGYDAPDAFAYHPTALGHQAMAGMIIDALGE
jgi:lysophospholipase L1-like esterase